MPADIAVDSINEYQVRELNRLKAWLYQRRINTRIERDKSERRQEKEEAQAQKKMEQPALFEF
jgi:hypothetical protein